MTPDEFLAERARSVRARIRDSSDALRNDLSDAVSPWVCEHPRSGLAAGGAAGFLIGAFVGALRSPRGAAAPRRGAISGSVSFFKKAVGVTVRSAIARQILGAASEAAAPPDPPEA